MGQRREKVYMDYQEPSWRLGKWLHSWLSEEFRGRKVSR